MVIVHNVFSAVSIRAKQYLKLGVVRLKDSWKAVDSFANKEGRRSMDIHMMMRKTASSSSRCFVQGDHSCSGKSWSSSSLQISRAFSRMLRILLSLSFSLVGCGLQDVVLVKVVLLLVLVGDENERSCWFSKNKDRNCSSSSDPRPRLRRCADAAPIVDVQAFLFMMMAVQ
jgi:hypothetical protein